jgi:nicotinate-nucleotide--dimethylbenzimidazole phosphoribosyltransferase
MLQIPIIKTIDPEISHRAQERWDNLIKPKGSLGRLEELVCRLCAVQHTVIPQVSRKRLVIFAADHGITQEGTSAYPSEVTAQMVRNFLHGNAAICVLSRTLNIELEIVDMGIQTEVNDPSLISHRIRSGSRNFLKEPAMTETEMQTAIQAGIGFAMAAKESGIQLLAGGDMGIGNSTASSAIFSSLLRIDPAEVTGYGAGLDENGRTRKIEVIRAAIKRWDSPSAPLEILRHFGGYEIAALTGLYIGGASEGIATLVDGFICTAAAAVAIQVSPRCKDYLFFSHASAERGYSQVLERLHLQPLLNLEMRLGEGTGAALAMQILDSAVALFRDMPTFEEAEVSRE